MEGLKCGTSAGTVLGAILFILHVFDSPEIIDTKYADNFITMIIKDSLKKLETEVS